jgi:hypothetical protein
MVDADILEEIDLLGGESAVVCRPEQCYKIVKSAPKNINILHLNIRRVNRNFDNLTVFLNSLNLTCDVIVLSERWITKCPLIPILEGYVSYHSSKIQSSSIQRTKMME